MTLHEMTNRLEEYAREATESFRDLSTEQINWKPNPDGWSVAQCLDHLREANTKELEVIGGAAKGEFNRTIWERLPGLPTLIGKLGIKIVDPENTKKSKAPKVFRPSQSQIPTQVLADYVETNERMRGLMKELHDGEIEKMVITSPIGRIVTYSVYHALMILVLHDRRHLNQAKRVMETPGFPT